MSLVAMGYPDATPVLLNTSRKPDEGPSRICFYAVGDVTALFTFIFTCRPPVRLSFYIFLISLDYEKCQSWILLL